MSTEPSVVSQKPVRPNPEEVQTQTKKLTDTIEKYAARIQEIKEITGGKKSKRNEVSPEEQEILKALKDSRAAFQSILREKQTIRDELNKSNEERKVLRSKVKELKKEIKYSTVEEIDQSILQLEEQINGTEELTEEQQELCIHEIKQLAKSKELLKSLWKQIEQVQADDALCEALVKKLKGLDDDLEDCKTTERELNKELEKVKKQRDVAEQDISTLDSEKRECWEIICALRAKKKELSDAFSTKMDQYYTLDRQYKQQLREEEYRKREEARCVQEPQQKEEQRPKIQEQKLEKAPVEEKESKKKVKKTIQPVSENDKIAIQRIDPERQKALRRQREQEKQYLLIQEKISTCDHLINYLTLQKPVEKTEENGQGPSHSSEGNLTPPVQGMKELHQDKKAELDGWFAGTGKKTKTKKGKKSVKNTIAEDKKLMHSFQNLQVFNELQVPVPNKQSEIESCIEFIEEKKKGFQTGSLETPSSTIDSTPPEQSNGVINEPTVEASPTESTIEEPSADPALQVDDKAEEVVQEIDEIEREIDEIEVLSKAEIEQMVCVDFEVVSDETPVEVKINFQVICV